ncbi:hypothetical protein AB204_00695 [Xenorhabdus khoisanae]|uniref:Uncharacterized protein n=1 Tax=Xenorhabdus khoisanae TaxID=880157 RepID=A0A0J5FXY0_9GAMM|nr:hypothetical protein [Xenorhabdus khoisanae]KMJ47048.1 hypothetical protein AB204_00695 [Xenorhabdus khoisanae]
MISDILRQAIKYSHSIFLGKTTNISYINPELQSEDRQRRYSKKNSQTREQEFLTLRSKLYRFGNIKEKYDCIMKEKELKQSLVGNCNELSITALMYLATKRAHEIYDLYKKYFTTDTSGKIQSIYIEIISPIPTSRYDHCFIIFYYPPDASDYQSQNKQVNSYYKTYNKLPSGAWICDPWANIVCLSQHYNANWQNKMISWATDGKYLALGNAHTPSVYKSQCPLQENPGYPLYENTFNMMRNTAMQVNHQVIIKPDSTVVINHSKFEYATL